MAKLGEQTETIILEPIWVPTEPEILEPVEPSKIEKEEPVPVKK